MLEHFPELALAEWLVILFGCGRGQRLGELFRRRWRFACRGHVRCIRATNFNNLRSGQLSETRTPFNDVSGKRGAPAGI